MDYTATKISRAEFEANLAEKLSDAAFIGDIIPLLRQDVGFDYDPVVVAEHVMNKIISRLDR